MAVRIDGKAASSQSEHAAFAVLDYLVLPSRRKLARTALPEGTMAASIACWTALPLRSRRASALT